MTMNEKTPSIHPSAMVLRFVIAIVVMIAVIFIPAGSFLFWNGWLYLAIIIIPAAIGITLVYRTNPDVLQRRMQYREKRNQQKWIIGLSYPFFILIFIIPGLDYRFGWSHIPPGIVIAGMIMVLVGYSLFFYVIYTNQFASRVVEVTENQKVIQTGPYALVRHPMYLAVILMYTITPIVLGSWWALIPATSVIPVLVFRILDEEKVLRKDLTGYIEYCQKVRCRIFPGIW
jgi:protein-S-isoprenylcysteine O-methyltransferase Ste14